MGFITAQKIREAYDKKECVVVIIYGSLGIGKSTMACKILAEVYGTKGKNGKIEKNWEAVKSRIVFTPKEFVEKVEHLISNDLREKALIWDDAGLALLSLDFNNPWVKDVTRFFNVMRTCLSCLILTTPLPTWIVRKIRGFPQCITIKIIRAQSDKTHPKRYRIGRAYRYWISPDMKKTGVTTIYEDHFTALMPNDFFYEFYEPYRNSYTKVAVRGMRDHLKDAIMDSGEELLS